MFRMRTAILLAVVVNTNVREEGCVVLVMVALRGVAVHVVLMVLVIRVVIAELVVGVLKRPLVMILLQVLPQLYPLLDIVEL